jgi:hypothetical protein
MRKKDIVLVFLGLMVGLAGGYFLARPRPVPAEKKASEAIVIPAPPPNVELAAPEPPPVEEIAKTEEEKKDSETAIAAPVPYFPPPTIDLSGATLGNQRVPGTSDIGDVYQILWDDKSQALYMAVIEPTQLRSIWRVGQNAVPERVFAANTAPGEIRIESDGSGVMYVMHDNPARVYRTDNAFKTWFTVLENKGMFWQMASDGKGNVYGALHGYNEAILYRSPDNGFSWEPWLDFQKLFPEYAVQYDPADPRFMLRHLHGVVYNELNDTLLVGTGDIARYTLESKDGGATWKKVWYEGFTAAAVMKGGNRYLLCPDKLRGPGLAVYDIKAGTSKEVWDPKSYNYAGYCYSIANADGIYYAAFHTEANEVADVVPKSGIIVSPDGETWYPFLEWDPLGHHARTNIWLATAPGRIYASVNGMLYTFAPLTKEWFATRTPFKK